MKRERWEDLLGLAQAYRGWSRQKLAEALGRDPHNLPQASGSPKIELVIRLAEILDWPVGMVIEDLTGESAGPEEQQSPQTWRELDQSAYDAYEAGQYDEVIRLARLAYRIAETPDQRAYSCVRECGGWDLTGRFPNELEAARRGLREKGLSPTPLMALHVYLANAHYVVGNLSEAHAVTDALLRRIASDRAFNGIYLGGRAQAHHVRGQVHRVWAGHDGFDQADHIRAGIADLAEAARLWTLESTDTGGEAALAAANVARGAAQELRVLAGERSAESAIAELLAGIDDADKPGAKSVGQWLECWGWWCIYGGNIALRHVSDESRLQHLMAIFTTKADDIAERLGNWALREQVWRLEHERRVRNGIIEDPQDWLIDRQDIQTLTGAMGRFPAFRETGWTILRSARRIEG